MLQTYKRSSSAPEFSSMAGGLSPMRRFRPLIMRTMRVWRSARYWKGWRFVTKVLLIGIHLALLFLLAKCTVFPTDNPREEWVPAQWGVPWYSASNSWASIAARRKAVLKEQAGADHRSFQSTPSRIGNKPVRLKYPILWAAPFFSRSGYGTEAISYIAGLLEYGLIAPEDLWITQAGDGRHPDALDGLSESIRQMLWDQEWHNVTKRLAPMDRDRPLVVVCHVFPDCWRTKNDDEQSRFAVVRLAKWLATEIKVRVWGLDHSKDNGCPCPNTYIKERVVYRVGRSMFETERLPTPLVAYADQLDEVLVPSKFSVDSFSASGIPASKLHTLPQGINTTLFDPSQHSPVDLASLEGSQVTGIARSYTHNVTTNNNKASEGHSTATTEDSENQRRLRMEKNHQGFAEAARGWWQGKRSSADGKLEGKDELERALHVAAEAATGLLAKAAGHRPASVEPFRFLSVFKWEIRKGWDILLRAYFEEFASHHDNVELHVVTHAFGQEVDNFRDFMRSAIKKMLNVTEDDHLDRKLPRVYVYDKYIPDSTYPGLYQAMDALVVPTHGEGWGRPQFEAMAMGIPVISTNWSGITAFMDDTVGYPIHVEAVVEVEDKSDDTFVWFKGQKWAQPSMSHLRQLMRDVINNRKQAAIKGQAARQRIQEEYSILAVARKAHTEIMRIQAEVDAIMSGGSFLRLPG